MITPLHPPLRLARALRHVVPLTFMLPVTVLAAPPIITTSSPEQHYYFVPEDPNAVQFGYAIVASNSPTSYNAMGLPANASINRTMGTITGGLSVPGAFPLSLSATNADGTGTASLRLMIHPAVIGVSSARGQYAPGQTFTITLTFNRAMLVTGRPGIGFAGSGATRVATYVSGSGTTALVFGYTVVGGDNTNGQPIQLLNLDTNTGTIRDVDGMDPSPRLPLRYFSSGITLTSPPATPAAVPPTPVVTSPPTAPPTSTVPPPSTPSVTPPAAPTSNPPPTTTAPTPVTTPPVATPPIATPTPVSTTTPAVSTTPVVAVASEPAAPASPSTPPENASAAGNTTPGIAIAASRLTNLSSRVHLREGDASRTFIAGFVVSGDTPKRMLVRAVGPALAAFDVQSPLANPRLRIVDAIGRTITENDDWSGGDTTAAFAQLGAFG